MAVSRARGLRRAADGSHRRLDRRPPGPREAGRAATRALRSRERRRPGAGRRRGAPRRRRAARGRARTRAPAVAVLPACVDRPDAGALRRSPHDGRAARAARRSRGRMELRRRTSAGGPTRSPRASPRSGRLSASPCASTSATRRRGTRSTAPRRAAVDRGGGRAVPRRGRERPLVRRGRVESGERRRRSLDRPGRRPLRPRAGTSPGSRAASPAEGRGGPHDWLDASSAFVPWSALAAKAPPGTALPPRVGDRWRFNVYRIERPGGPADPEKGVLNLAWAPTGQHSFHVPEAFREIEFRRAGGRVGEPGSRAVRACGSATRRRASRWAAPPRSGPAAPSARRSPRPWRPGSTRWTASTRCSATTARRPAVAPQPRGGARGGRGPARARGAPGRVPALEPRVGRRLRRHRRPADEGLGLLPRRGPAARRARSCGPRSPSSATATSSWTARATRSASTGPAWSSTSAASARATRPTAWSRAAAPRHRFGARQPRRQQRLRPRHAAGSPGLGGRGRGSESDPTARP